MVGPPVRISQRGSDSTVRHPGDHMLRRFDRSVHDGNVLCPVRMLGGVMTPPRICNGRRRAPSVGHGAWAMRPARQVRSVEQDLPGLVGEGDWVRPSWRRRHRRCVGLMAGRARCACGSCWLPDQLRRLPSSSDTVVCLRSAIDTLVDASRSCAVDRAARAPRAGASVPVTPSHPADQFVAGRRYFTVPGQERAPGRFADLVGREPARRDIGSTPRFCVLSPLMRGRTWR